MKVLIHTYGYPSVRNPYMHTFVRDEAELLNRSEQLQLAVIVSNPLRMADLKSKEVFLNSAFPVHSVLYPSVPRRRLAGLTAAFLSRAMLPVLRQTKPDLLHCHFIYPAGLVAPLAQKLNLPFIVTTHGDDFYSSIKVKSLYARVEQTLRLAQKVVCVGPKLRDDVIREFPFLAAKTETVMHGIDFSYFGPHEADTALQREHKQLDPDKIHALCVARISRVKGLHVLAEAISQSRRLREDCVFHIVGPVSDAAYEAELKNQLKSLKLNNVLFHGAEDKQGLRSWYRACHFYVQPSLSETFGMTILEALACGKPVVGTKSGGPEAIITADNGMLAELQPEHLKECMEVMCTNYAAYDATAIHEDAGRRFSEETKRVRLLGIYQSVMESAAEEG